MVSFINTGDTKGRAFQFGEGKPLLLLFDQFHLFVFIYTPAQSLRMAFFSAIVKEVFIPYNMLEKTTCHHGDVFCCLQSTGNCASLSALLRAL